MIFDTPEGIAFYQLAARRAAVSLEIAGMHRRGRSAYSICKSEYGLHGSRASVLAQLDAMIHEILVDRATQRLIDWTDQGVCPDGHPCEIMRADAPYPFLRVCNTDHYDDMIWRRPFRSMPLLRDDLTAERIDAIEKDGANARLVAWARNWLADQTD